MGSPAGRGGLLGTAWSPSTVRGQPGARLRSGGQPGARLQGRPRDSLEPACGPGAAWSPPAGEARGVGSGWRHFQQRGSSRAPACSACSVRCPAGWGRHLRNPGALGSSPRGSPAVLSHQGCISLCVWCSGTLMWRLRQHSCSFSTASLLPVTAQEML